MELGELKTFVTVAAERSFSLAAIRLCRTQPAVSQAIRRLEKDLGERLFDRGAKHPTLTQAGDALLPTRHPFASRRELPMTMLHSDRLVTLAGVPLPTPVSTCATIDSAPPTGRFVIMPGVDSLKQAVANGLGIGIVPRAAVSSLTAHAGLVVIPLSAARAASAPTLVYRHSDGQPSAVEDFVDAVRSMGEDRASRMAPIAGRASR